MGANEPAPPDHVAFVAEPPIVPARGAVASAHIDWSDPAFTVGAGYIVTTMASLTEVQGPVGSLVVRVRVTVPEAISAALGLYVVASAVAFANEPVPDELHVEVEAPPPLVPETETTLPAQMSWSIPAFTVGAGEIVRTIASDLAEHGPAGLFVARVSVTVPAEMSPALGV